MCFRGLAECQAKLNVAFQLSGVKPALAGFGGVVELEKSELDRALGEGRVEVEHMVAAPVVVCAPEIVAEGRVPNLRKLAHRGGLCSVQPSQEGNVNNLSFIVLMVFNRIVFFLTFKGTTGSDRNNSISYSKIDILKQFLLFSIGIGN